MRGRKRIRHTTKSVCRATTPRMKDDGPLRCYSSSTLRWGRAALLLSVLLCATAGSQVYSQPLLTEERPIFLEFVNNVTVIIGRDATLSCVVDHLGPYKVAWIHLERQMVVTVQRHVVTRIPRFSVSHDHHRQWNLHIRGAQPEDAGRYMCQVDSEPMISQLGIVEVVVPPTIIDEESSASHLSIREGGKITLTCRGDGVPAPRITWRREDGRAINMGSDRRRLSPVHEHQDLHFNKVSRTDGGAYLCIASNGVPPSVSKRIMLDVEFPPMVWVPNQLVGAPIGSTVNLECHAEAHPRPINYWVKDDVMLLPGRKIRSEVFDNGYKSHMKLTIQHLTESDFGNYRCMSKNSLGEAEGSIKLFEIASSTATTKPLRAFHDEDLETVHLEETQRTTIVPNDFTYPRKHFSPATESGQRIRKRPETYGETKAKSSTNIVSSHQWHYIWICLLGFLISFKFLL